MKYFIKLSKNGPFPPGYSDNSTYEISEKFYDELVTSMLDQVNRGKAKLI